MELLQALVVAFSRENVGECPETQVVHVAHYVPGIAEGYHDTLEEEGVLELGLSAAPAHATEVSELLRAVFNLLALSIFEIIIYVSNKLR